MVPKKNTVPTIAAAVVVLAGGYAAWHFLGAKPAEQTAPPPPPVPVSTAVAKMQDVPVYLRGIGTVQALSAIEIHPQVGGVLIDLPVREGQEVTKDQVVAVIDPRPLKAELDRAQAQQVQDQSQLTNAKLDQQRYAALVTKDFASRQQLDTQVATVARLQGAIAADQAAIDEAQINLGYAVVHSPINGRVSLRRVDPGNLIQANATGPGIISIQQVHPISVVFTLPEEDLNNVRAAMAKTKLNVYADSSDGQRQLAVGTLMTPNNAIDTGTGTIQFKAVFPNDDDTLTPGQFVSTRLQIDIAHGVSVPHDAVQHSPDGLFVFAVDGNKKAERRTVQVAYDDGTNAVIQKGLADKDRVVTSGQSRIGPGTTLAFNSGAAPGDGQSSENQPAGDQPTADQSASR